MVPGITHIFVQNYIEPCLKIYIMNSRTDIYNIMYSIDSHDIKKTSYFYDVISSGDKLIPSNSTTESLYLIGTNFDFIGFWLKCFDKNYQSQSNICSKAMQELLNKIPVQLPKRLSHR